VKHINKRVCKIVGEMMNFMLSIGATNINVNLQDMDYCFKISINSDYSEEKYKKIEKLVRALKSPKAEEVEEYYWELTGESDMGTELYLVGMMVDGSEINVQDEQLELILYKCKE